MGVTSELQAIIMAGGKGSRMPELTAKKPKCLLPIGNLPMVWYPIRLLEKSGFQEVTVVVCEWARAEVQSALDGLGVRCDLVALPASADDWGTADTLRHLADTARLKGEADLLVVPCDLVTDCGLGPLLDLFRQYDATLAALFFPPPTATPAPPTAPGPKTKDKPERDLVCVEAEGGRLVSVSSASDHERSVRMSRATLRGHGGRVRVHSRLLDAHVYILRRSLCQYLQHNRSMSTLKGELVPHAVKQQRRNHNLNHTDSAEVRCYALVAPDTAYATRANTLLDYCRANNQVLGWGGEVSGQAQVHPSAHLSDSAVGAGSKVGDRVVVRASAVGPQATIASHSRLSHTVVMAGATIGQRCVLSNCVVGEGAVVGDNCQLTDCLVGDRHTLPPLQKRSNEVLTDDDHLIEII